jgi:hypothetical protein
MRIMSLYFLLSVLLHLELPSFPMALLPFIPENEISVVSP